MQAFRSLPPPCFPGHSLLLYRAMIVDPFLCASPPKYARSRFLTRFSYSRRTPPPLRFQKLSPLFFAGWKSIMPCPHSSTESLSFSIDPFHMDGISSFPRLPPFQPAAKCPWYLSPPTAEKALSLCARVPDGTPSLFFLPRKPATLRVTAPLGSLYMHRP